MASKLVAAAAPPSPATVAGAPLADDDGTDALDADDDERDAMFLREFGTGALKLDRVINIVGGRRSDRSHLLKAILSNIAHIFDVCAGMSPTPEGQELLGEFMPESCIYDEYDGASIQRMINTLRVMNRMGKYPRALLVLDDCVSDPSVLRSAAMLDLHMNGRMVRLSVINIMQHTPDMPRGIRSLVDYVFAFGEPREDFRGRLRDHFFAISHDRNEFAAAFDVCTDRRGCMVINNTASTNAVEDNVFWYRASADPHVGPIGAPAVWRLHHMFCTRLSPTPESQDLFRKFVPDSCPCARHDR